LDATAASKLAELEASALRRELIETDRTDEVTVERGGRTLISFCCNDYLNLSHHPEVKQAAVAAIERLGTGAGASRLVTGNHSLLGQLEAKLAAHKGTEAALVFGSGYLANLGTIPALMGAGDLILLDELSHACMHAGARLSGATVMAFPHNDLANCARMLGQVRSKHARCLILTETVFSMDGDRAPLPKLAELARKHDAWLMSDDAHGLGVGAQDPVPGDIQMGTLSKAAGSYGGYVCGSRALIDLLINRARTVIYSTGLPPASAAAALCALRIIERIPSLAMKPIANARRFAHALGLQLPDSAIVPLVLGDETRALDASRALEAQGFLVTAIRPPTVPDRTARLRFTFTAAHTAEQIDRLVAAVRKL
jgi:8-amino-7-oxononanoate synthase